MKLRAEKMNKSDGDATQCCRGNHFAVQAFPDGRVGVRRYRIPDSIGVVLHTLTIQCSISVQQCSVLWVQKKNFKM